MASEVSVSSLVNTYSVTGLSEKILASVGSDRGSRFEGDTYNTALYIQRSKNANIVCYSGAYLDAAAGVLDPKAPLDAYWMDIDPEYVKANRASGKMDNRVELNFIDRTMAYGHSPSEPRDATGVLFFEVSFVALKSRKMQCLSVPGGHNGAAHTPVLLVVIGGEVSVITRIYVQATESSWNPIPSVAYVELFGHSVATGQPTYEKIVNE